MNKAGIYKIVNISNSKFYIGSAIILNTRWSRHKYNLRNNKHPNIILQNVWNKYGEEIFDFVIVEVIENFTKEKLLEREQFYIDTLKPEYNFRKIANSNLGIKYNLKSPKRIKGHVSPIKGVSQSEEHKKKLSESQKNRVFTKEHLINLRIGIKNRKCGKRGKYKPRVKI